MKGGSIRALGWMSIVLLGVASPASQAVGDPNAPLRVLGDSRGIVIGAAVNSRALERDAEYRVLLGQQFSAITPENDLKWENLAPLPGSYNWAEADRSVDFAISHGQSVRGHTLVWHSQAPDWIQRLTSAELRETVSAHIATVVGRYTGRISSWDVVNEPLNGDGSLRESFWMQKLGSSYIADAFRAARRTDPDAKLYLNEFGVETFNAKSDGLYELVRALIAEGVPLDGVGFQSHLRVGEVPVDLERNLRRFADLGVEIAITELDVRVQLPVTPSDLAQQANDYQTVMRACLATKTCAGVTIWGFTDRSSWVPETYPGWGAALPWGEQLERKPARDSLGWAFVS